ncbi:MAG: restriction endonuclease subunit S [Candidatus Cloacimonetes bacterium]|nr:restriction endonuclease subunit S [Candidatus Cloacimonadota bacterium]
MNVIRISPELRFPEFNEMWELSILGEKASFYKGKGISKTDIHPEGEINCIRYGELYTTYNEIISSVYSNTNLDIRVLVLSEENDVIIPASGETNLDIATASCITKSGIAIGGDINIIRSSINGVFLSYYLNNKMRYSIARLAQGNSIVHLYPSHLKTLKLRLPKTIEQTKISNFITSVDEKIEQISSEKELLEEYKKGVIQKIFSQKIRFKNDNGNNFPNWEEKKLGQIIKPIIRSVDKPNKPYETLGIRSHAKGTFHKFIDNPDNISMTKLFKVREGDLIVNITFAWEHAIAVCKKQDNCRLVSHRFPTYLIKDNNDINFLEYFVKRKRFKYQLGVISPGGAGRNRVMCKKDFLKLKVSIPVLEEQIKIADFLISIDDKIDKISQKLELMKKWKKGLLQKMFV